ncbi:MAG TPA: YdeI/OmpD-associated family protein [Actinomycetota bacterium]|nr:YdeI/OmpD-associated family protein [Actinomycetota bacterium]
MTGPELVEVADRAAWRRWLSKHHRTHDAIWLVIHKKRSTTGTLGYEDAVCEALCFGWIDSTANTLDDERYKLWMAPRKAKSAWSAVNKRRIENLVSSGAMTHSGMAVIEAAKADGSWAALERSDALELPDDLVAAFHRHGGSREHWDAFPPGVRKQILEWIYAAKRDDTRAKRVEETATLAARNERANQWRPKR